MERSQSVSSHLPEGRALSISLVGAGVAPRRHPGSTPPAPALPAAPAPHVHPMETKRGVGEQPKLVTTLLREGLTAFHKSAFKLSKRGLQGIFRSRGFGKVFKTAQVAYFTSAVCPENFLRRTLSVLPMSCIYSSARNTSSFRTASSSRRAARSIQRV
jgi:hypothetical protein